MKISKDKLKTIIKEELEQDAGDYEGSMAKENLYKIAKYAQNMMDLIGDTDDLEPWLEEKIAVASYIMDTVGHHLEYKAEMGGHGQGDEMMGGEYPEQDDGGDEAYVISIGDEEGGFEDGEESEYGSDEEDGESAEYGSDDEGGYESDEESEEDEAGEEESEEGESY